MRKTLRVYPPHFDARPKCRGELRELKRTKAKSRSAKFLEVNGIRFIGIWHTSMLSFFTPDKLSSAIRHETSEVSCGPNHREQNPKSGTQGTNPKSPAPRACRRPTLASLIATQHKRLRRWMRSSRSHVRGSPAGKLWTRINCAAQSAVVSMDFNRMDSAAC